MKSIFKYFFESRFNTFDCVSIGVIVSIAPEYEHPILASCGWVILAFIISMIGENIMRSMR